MTNHDPGGGAVWQDLTCTHDDNGNLTSDGLHSYTYDAWNRLVAVAYDNAVAGDTDPTIATYVYDGLFRRISKTVSGARGGGIVYNSDADGSGIVARFRSEHYFYAGWRVVEVTNWDPSAFGAYDHTTADVLGQFVYGTQYVDEPVRYDRNLDVGTNDSCIGGGDQDASSDASYYYHQDANYRVVAVTDEAGNVVERYEYTAYGDTVVLGGYDAAAGAELGNRRLTSIVGNPLQHQGLFRDRETGTYQNRFRQYHPRLGRFVQRDPLGYVDGMGLYEYVASRPAAATDPTGQTIMWIPIKPFLPPIPLPGTETPPHPTSDDPQVGVTPGVVVVLPEHFTFNCAGWATGNFCWLVPDDTDGDGKIDPDEMQAFIDGLGCQKKGSGPCPPGSNATCFFLRDDHKDFHVMDCDPPCTEKAGSGPIRGVPGDPGISEGLHGPGRKPFPAGNGENVFCCPQGTLPEFY